MISDQASAFANPAYAAIGTTITGPTADLNLGIKTFLNGALVSNIVIDTSEPATDTIDFVATDQSGLTAKRTFHLAHLGCE